MKISIAGAGAGKTTTMADKIVKMHLQSEEYLNIYCITFTNNAAACIEKKIKKHYGELPKNIIVSTIHSFLYREIIKPYYYILYNKQYERISTAKLPNVPKYKNATIKRLEDENVLHQTVIPERAKWVLAKKSTDKKTIKEKRKAVKSTFKEYCGAIFIDEAQDLDPNMLEIIEVLNEMKIEIILMGDPKQDLKGYRCLRQIIEKHPNSIEYLPVCHRCPQEHLKLSNLIVSENEQQLSGKKEGLVKIHFENEKGCRELIRENSFDLIYISKKQDIYETHNREDNHAIVDMIFEEIKIAMSANHPNFTELSLNLKSYYLAEQLLEKYRRTNKKNESMNTTFKNETLNRSIYGRIISLLTDKVNVTIDEKILINSIDSIKGQEGNNCLFILTTDLAAYLFGDKDEQTTTKNRLYVGLTRSLNTLNILVTAKVEKKYGKKVILEFFHKTLTDAF